MWESHEDFTPWMSNAWQEGDKARTAQELHRKLVAVTKKLDGWGRTTFGHVRLELKRLREELEQLQADPSRTGPSHREIKITDRIVELNHREEIMWQQRSRISWLMAGDKNTRFFHLRASQCRRKNRISKLKRPDGQLTEDLQEMGNLISSFYKELYTS
jgi:hypothetical protein